MDDLSFTFTRTCALELPPTITGHCKGISARSTSMVVTTNRGLSLVEKLPRYQ